MVEMSGKELPEMTDEELIEALTPIIRSTVNANYYRVLGITSLPFDIRDVERYIVLQTEGKGEFFGETEDRLEKGRARWFIWRDCDVSKGHGITFSMHVWGRVGGINTVFTRTGFYKMYLLRSKIESVLRLPRYTLAPLR